MLILGILLFIFGIFAADDPRINDSLGVFVVFTLMALVCFFIRFEKFLPAIWDGVVHLWNL